MPALVSSLTAKFVLVAVLFGCVFAQALADVTTARDQLERQTHAITEISAQLTEPGADLLPLREQLIVARARAETLLINVEADRTRIENDIEKLGDPIDDEAPVVTARRAELKRSQGIAGAAISQANLNIEEAERLLAEIAQQRRAQFYDGVLERRPPPFGAGELTSAIQTVQRGAANAIDDGRGWLADQRARSRLWQTGLVLLGAFVFAILMAAPFRLWLDRRFAQELERMKPLQSRKVLVAGVRTLSRAAPAVIGAFTLYIAVLATAGLDISALPLVRSILIGFIGVILVDSAAVAVFAPRQSDWRLLNLTTGGAAVVRGLFVLAALFMAIDQIFGEGALVFGASDALASVQNAVTAISLGVVFVLLARPRWWRAPQDDDAASPAPLPSFAPALGLVVGAVGAGSILAALIGYTSLAHFAATRAFYVLALIIGALLVRAILRETVRLVDHRFSSEAVEGERVVFFWIGLIVDVVVFLAVLPPLFLLFGADWSDVRTAAGEALTGFQIGSVRISILQVLLAVATIIALLLVTRILQRAVESRIFPRARMDTGVQNSLKSLIGYVGLVIAFMTGVGMLGFDLSNLAIIAGALSVGIGFGLQSIVNNFVSGLILLFERPIKVGDWIVTPSGEGIVKRISVRSTEIETFDRSSIIVPNSELISSSVVNWTHKDKLGRVTVPVGVSYNEDPDRILELLATVSEDIDIVLDNPEPLVLFTGFGDSSLDFEVRAYIADVSRSIIARTEIRKAIFKRFKDAGVEIPFPQRDLHLRSSAIKFGDA